MQVRYIHYKLLSIFFFIIFFACNDHNKSNSDKRFLSQDSINIRMMNTNKILSENENDKINDFISRYQWHMKMTGSGLRYFIYKSGNGDKPKIGKIVKINYKLSLLNGVSIYTSDENGPKIFEIGKAQVETGLEEGILLLKVGDKAKFIIPSHLGFGLLGDQNKIPRKASLVYDVELISCENTKSK